MKRFASVESKLGQAVVGGGARNPAEPIISSSPAMNQPGKKMTKAEQMKLRMSGGGASAQ